MSEFIALFYAKWFLISSLTACSPRLDLETIWDMKRYKTYKPDIAQKCLTSMANHPWYLHPNLIPFNLLDAGVSDDEKREIANKLLEIDPNVKVNPKYKKTYRRAGQRCFGLLALINRPQVRYIHLPERMIVPGSLIPSHKYILKNLTFVVRSHTCVYVTTLVKSFTWPG